MAKHVHHTACAPTDIDSFADFVTHVVGMPSNGFVKAPAEIGQAIFGWPAQDALIFGDGKMGRIEAVSIPKDQRSRVSTGITALCFASRDLDDIDAKCKARGLSTERFEVVDDNNPLHGLTVEVAGVRFLFEHFE